MARKATRVAVGGFIHETNTFSPHKATFDDFAKADGWPALVMGEELAEAVANYALPITGFIEQAKEEGFLIKPLLWCSAQPCGAVSKDAFERIMAMLLFSLKQAMPLDAVYLDLHGAMVTETHRDGEAEIIRRVRKVVGMQVPIIASLDFHANVSKTMVEGSDMLVGFRTYPHTDMKKTGMRAATLLTQRMEYPAGLYKAFRQIPFLVPITSQTTLMEPAKSLFASLAGYENEEVLSVSALMGFPPSDTEHTSPSVVVYATSEKHADSAADSIERHFLKAEKEFSATLWQPDGAVRLAMMEHKGKPVILADTQDNPGAGGSSDTIGILEALIRNKAKDAVVACICDPAVAALAHRMGEGKEINCKVGAKTENSEETAPTRNWKVEKLGNGSFIATGAMYGGNRMELGLMALLSYEGVKVIISSVKQQAATKAIFTHLGVDAAEQKILALKSSVHFRADFADIAEEVLIVESPGINLEDPEKFAYQHLRSGVRCRPEGKN